MLKAGTDLSLVLGCAVNWEDFTFIIVLSNTAGLSQEEESLLGGHLPQTLGLILTTDSPPGLKVWHVCAPSWSAAPLYRSHFTSVASSQGTYNAAAFFAPSKLVGFELEVLTPWCWMALAEDFLEKTFPIFIAAE